MHIYNINLLTYLLTCVIPKLVNDSLNIANYLLIQFNLCLYFPLANFLRLLLKASMQRQHSTDVCGILLLSRS